MKKIILSLILGASISNGVAQAPDYGFETWTNVPLSSTIQDPVGWASFNAVVIAGMNQTVFKETAAPYVGTTSARIVTEVLPSSVMIPNPFNSAENMDTVGLLVTGKTQVSSTAPVIFGKPFTQTPASLDFAYKYNPVIGDSGFVVVYLTKWAGTQRDTVARGFFGTNTQVLTWTPQNLTLSWGASIVAPDSQHVYVSSSIYRTYGAKQGSTFYIDALTWLGNVGIDDISGSNATITKYPNPAREQISFKSSADVSFIQVMDITGRNIAEYKMNDSKVTIETFNFSNGLYLYTITNDKKQIVHRGKFEVAK